MNIELDVHTHTLVSGHAYSSLQEMVYAATTKDLKLLGITEHGPAIPGTCDPIYFRNMHVVPRHMYNMDLLLGAEANILDCHGNLDLDERHLKLLDFCIAGIHSLCYAQNNRAANTKGVIEVIRNPYVQIISHPGDGTAELDFRQLVVEAKKNNKLLEINNSSLKPCRNKSQARANNLSILQWCHHYDVPVLLGSDAHISFDVANFEYLEALLQEIDFPEELIINTDVTQFRAYLGI